MQKILVFGANSAVASACSRLWAEEGHSLFLVGRDPRKLQALVDDLKVRNAGRIESMAADLEAIDAHAKIFSTAAEKLGGLDTIFIAHGVLGDQSLAEKDFVETQKLLQVNLISQLSLLTLGANLLENQGSGRIGVITSVAGDRGRQSNYVYGMCKGAISIFLSGLRHRLFSKGISVTDIKLGFVDSPMTRHIEKKGLLWKKPEQVAKLTIKALERRRKVVYVPFFWRWIMLIIKNLPEFVFLRTKI